MLMEVNYKVKFETFRGDQTGGGCRITRTQVVIEGGTARDIQEVSSDEEEKQNYIHEKSGCCNE